MFEPLFHNSPQPTFWSLQEWSDGAVAVMGLIISAITLMSWVAVNIYRMNKRIRENVVRDDRDRELLNRAALELNPNHGGSIKDAIGRIEDSLTMQSNQMKAAHDRISSVEERTREVAHRLDQVVMAMIRRKED